MVPIIAWQAASEWLIGLLAATWFAGLIGKRVQRQEPADVPGFPHLPADVAAAIAEFDSRLADGTLPLAADGHPEIPRDDEAWITQWVEATLPDELSYRPMGRPYDATAWGDPREPSPATPQGWASK